MHHRWAFLSGESPERNSAFLRVSKGDLYSIRAGFAETVKPKLAEKTGKTGGDGNAAWGDCKGKNGDSLCPLAPSPPYGERVGVRGMKRAWAAFLQRV
jgi:hypothetical protein